MTKAFFTVGHSNRSLAQFVDLLRDPGIERVVDIRKFPMSRTHPQFNTDTLPDALAAFQISYEHLAALGGFRGKAPRLPRAINGFWTNESFHNYADYALSPEFRLGFERLRAVGHSQRCAIMCSEAVWWRCHRRIVSDYLIGAGETVIHIMNEGRLVPAVLTAGARVEGDGSIVYPAVEA